MRNVAPKIWLLLGNNAFQVAVTFLLSGFLAGALFTLLTLSPALEQFFFLPGGSPVRLFPEARFSWYIAFSLFFVLGITLGSLVSLQRVEFLREFRLTAVRSLSACAFVGAAIPLSYLLFSTTFRIFPFLLMWLVVPVLLVTTLALATCFVTRSLRMLPFALLTNIVSIIVALGFHLLTFWLLRKQGYFAIEFFMWAGLFSLLSLSFSLCLLRQARGK